MQIDRQTDRQGHNIASCGKMYCQAVCDSKSNLGQNYTVYYSDSADSIPIYTCRYLPKVHLQCTFVQCTNFLPPHIPPTLPQTMLLGLPFVSSELQPHTPLCAPHLIIVPWIHTSLPSERHLDRFSRFCMDHGSVQQTDAQADHAT